ncbi:hypothetical protein AMST5_03062 [freshwater sediment metagenome]|uniref:Uncharacterized protein n=1 Tax=freshwater sediment metagenome TaxID=556182 RepID=A0AA48RAB8_9ZZZZ
MGEDDKEAIGFSTVPLAGAHPPTSQGHDPLILSAALRLSVHQGQVLNFLLAKPLTLIKELERHFGLTSEARRTIICRLRERLQYHRIRIITHPGAGYSIPSEDRARIAEIVEQFRSI